MQGGIPDRDIDALAGYWSAFPGLRAALFQLLRSGYAQLAVPSAQLKTTIYQHPEFTAFIERMNGHFAAWRIKTAATLKALASGCHPKEVIGQLSEGLLAHYANQPLIEPYDLYQQLMDYWAGTMQDDAYLIAAEGWKAAPYRVIEMDKKGKAKDKGWACDLVPKALIVARYYAGDQAALDALNADLETAIAQRAELEEEHGGEEAAFSGFEKINVASVKDRIREISDGPEGAEELRVLREWLRLAAEEATLKKAIKDDESALDAQVYAHYATLSEDDIKTLVVDDKWLAALDAAIHGEIERISQQLTRRVKELAERYETPLPELNQRVTELEAKVNAHLERMGFAW